MDCLLHLGRCEECLKMVETELERGPPTPQLHLMRAKISLLFEKVNLSLTKLFAIFRYLKKGGKVHFPKLCSFSLIEQRGLPKYHTSAGA